MAPEIYEFQDYKAYLEAWIRAKPRRGHGVRSEMAEAMNCQGAYISQVLNGSAHLSLEQAEALNRYLGHGTDEAHYFLLLLQLERAGTRELKHYFRQQLEQVVQRRLILKERLDVKKSLRIEDQATYYSSWHFAAIHVALTIPELQTREKLSERLGLSPAKVSQALDFLVSAGLATMDSGRYLIGPTRIHLGDDSPMISKHHTNWRMKAIDSLDKTEETDLHYSSVVTISGDDVTKLKSMLVKMITEAKAVIRDSDAEDAHCFSLDFFRLKR